MVLQSSTEERWNCITHGAGVVLFSIGFIVLLLQNSKLTSYSTYAIVIYSISLLLLYAASTAYHYSTNPVTKNKLRILDHISIYVLIAGTYTPVTLITLQHSKGWLLFALVWALAALGTLLKLFFTGRFEIISLLLYLIMGWLIMLDIEFLSQQVGDTGMNFLIYGGVAYTGGIVFYVMRKLKFHHVIWHLFVLAGSLFHYFFILNHII